MNISHTSYASDEDVALLSPSDVGPLFPIDQVLASGADGSFDPSDRWTLHSNSVSFLASGIQPGHVIRLTGPVEQFRHPGVLVGVAEVFDHSVALRRLGMAVGLGEPVAPPEGLTGVCFVAKTLEPQLELASREVDHLLGLRAGSSTADLRTSYSESQLRDAVVRLVLARRYEAVTREGDAAFATRARLFAASFDRLITRLLLLDHPNAPNRPPRFGTRLVR